LPAIRGAPGLAGARAPAHAHRRVGRCRRYGEGAVDETERLDGGLVLRRATAADAEELAECYGAAVFGTPSTTTP
jgi:hypothetical protein